MNNITLSQTGNLLLRGSELTRYENELQSRNIATGDVAKKVLRYKISSLALSILTVATSLVVATGHLPLIVPIVLGVATAATASYTAWKAYHLARSLIAKEQDHQNRIPEIPADAMGIILKDLPLQDLVRFRATNKVFKNICNDIIVNRINSGVVFLNNRINPIKFIESLDVDSRKKIKFIRFDKFIRDKHFIDNLVKLAPNLKDFAFSQKIEIFNTYLGQLSQLTHLEKLTHIDCTYLTDEGFQGIKLFKHLKELFLCDFKNITDSGILPLSHLTQLERLSITNSFNVSDDGLAQLSTLTQLTHLDLSLCRGISGTGIVQAFKNSPLVSLKLFSTLSLSDSDLQKFAENFAHLEELDLQACPGITDTGIQYLSGLPNLKRLIVDSCPGVTRAGLDALKASHPTLEIL